MMDGWKIPHFKKGVYQKINHFQSILNNENGSDFPDYTPIHPWMSHSFRECLGTAGAGEQLGWRALLKSTTAMERFEPVTFLLQIQVLNLSQLFCLKVQ